MLIAYKGLTKTMSNKEFRRLRAFEKAANHAPSWNGVSRFQAKKPRSAEKHSRNKTAIEFKDYMSIAVMQQVSQS